jgi:hypothetical protein
MEYLVRVSAAVRSAVVWTLIGLAWPLSAASCVWGPRDPARALVEAMAEAAEDRDAERVLARLSDAFRGQVNLTRADAGAALRKYFAGYESIDLEVFDVASEPGEGVTRVLTRIGFTGQANRAFGLGGLLPPSAVYRFDLDIRVEGGVWRVSRAAWEVAPPPGTVAAP